MAMSEETHSQALEIVSYGLVLRTERFDACVAFYSEVVGLTVRFQKEGLVCFRFGDGYLMVETGGRAKDGPKPAGQNPVKLRFNVPDVDAAAETLRSRGADVTVERFDWGVRGEFLDPDGNICALKNADDPAFSKCRLQ